MLGQRVADLHRAIARVPTRLEFRPEPYLPMDQRSFTSRCATSPAVRCVSFATRFRSCRRDGPAGARDHRREPLLYKRLSRSWVGD